VVTGVPVGRTVTRPAPEFDVFTPIRRPDDPPAERSYRPAGRDGQPAEAGYSGAYPVAPAGSRDGGPGQPGRPGHPGQPGPRPGDAGGQDAPAAGGSPFGGSPFGAAPFGAGTSFGSAFPAGAAAPAGAGSPAASAANPAVASGPPGGADPSRAPYTGGHPYQEPVPYPGSGPYPAASPGDGPAPGQPAPAADEPGDDGGDFSGLPRRVRQANLAPQLRASSASGTQGSAVPQATAASLADMRNTLSAMQRGWQQGRSQVQRDTEGEADGH
jgi:hypothetical protein